MSKKILIVDDSASMRKMMVVPLREAGYEVTEAVDGHDALAKLGAGFDVLITDFNMPNMSGLQLLKIARALPQYKQVPILMLTTETDGDKRQAGRVAGATGWIVKPVQPKLLLAAVQKLTE